MKPVIGTISVSVLLMSSSIIAQAADSSAQYREVTRMPNLKLLPIGLMGIGLAVDMFAEAGDLGSAISAARQMDPQADVKHLRNSKTRKEVVATMLLIGSAVELLFAIKEEQVMVRIQPDQVQLALRF